MNLPLSLRRALIIAGVGVVVIRPLPSMGEPGSEQRLSFNVDEGLNLNSFLRDGPVAAHLLLRAGTDPRILIAFPAGIARMNKVRFHVYTFIGSWPWCFVLAYIGMKLGADWDSDPKFKAVFHHFQFGVEAVLLIGVAYFVWTHWKNRSKLAID